MKLFIPTIGTKLKLTQDWKFHIQSEYRNSKILEAIGWRGGDAPRWDRGDLKMETVPVELVRQFGSPEVIMPDENFPHMKAIIFPFFLPAQSVLQVDRIYIRKGAGDFDSITFLIQDCPDKRYAPKKAKGFLSGATRFWVRLNEANEIECDVV